MGDNDDDRQMMTGQMPHQLEAWWEHGAGAAQIKWGVKGDFDRCVRMAIEHAKMTPDQAKGFCNRRHMAVLGKAPGQEHPKEAVKVGKERDMADTYDPDGLDSSWDSVDDLPDLTGLEVSDFEAAATALGIESKESPIEGSERAGGRFARLTAKLAAKGARTPKALAAWIGRRKYGKAAFQKMAGAAKKRKREESLVTDLFRARWPMEFRGEDGSPPTLFGHFAVFNQWAEINSAYEGHFMERIAPGSFAKTFSENRDNIRVLFQHGRDPQIGDKPLGRASRLEEDDYGAAYEVPLLDTSYNRDLVPGLKEGLYGASFRMRVTREDFLRADDPRHPGPSEYNPEALPERTIKEIHCSELGPVTFPAYRTATAGLRSITDEVLLLAYTRDRDRFLTLIRQVDPDILQAIPAAPSDGAESDLTLSERREPKTGKLEIVKRTPESLKLAYERAQQRSRATDVRR